MLHLKNIYIKYDNEIINNGELLIRDDAITVITGNSGSGKTSLLYLLGMISVNEEYKYFIDHKEVNMNDKKLINGLQQNLFGILFQDGSLIETLTVKENITLAAKTAGRELSDGEIEELLNMIDLSTRVAEMYPLKLSGGERQRASLAMVLAKRPRYILADEPTASLDYENTKKIIDIFKKLKKLGHTIIISTHSKEVSEAADIMYCIKDTKLVCEQELHLKNSKEMDVNIAIKKLGNNIKIKDEIWYAKNSKKKGKALQILLIIFCIIAISGFAVTNNVLGFLVQTQENLINRLSDREIYVVNQSTSSDSEALDADGNLMISNDILKYISGMNGVDKVYEMMAWRSFALNNSDITIKNNITVDMDANEYSIEYSLDNSDKDYYSVLPYFEEQKYENQLYKKYDNSEDEVYVSYDLAEELGIIDEEAAELILQFEAGIPVYKMITESENNKDEEESDLDIVEFETIKVSVAGILNDNVKNRYTIDGNSVIYMPYEKMRGMKESYKVKNDYSGEYSNYSLEEWMPSACVVYTNSYKNVNIVKGKIENTGTNIVTRYDYQDTESIEALMSNLKNVTNWVIGVILLIIFALMSAVFISTTVGRKREYAILKANGFSTQTLSQITIIESIFQSIKILVISLLCSIALTGCLSVFLLGHYRFMTSETTLYVIIFAFIFVMVPSVISILYISRLKVEKIIRN